MVDADVLVCITQFRFEHSYWNPISAPLQPELAWARINLTGLPQTSLMGNCLSQQGISVCEKANTVRHTCKTRSKG